MQIFTQISLVGRSLRQRSRIVNATLVVCALAGVQAFATNYTVIAGGGGNFTTLQACSNAMVAGDTCTAEANTPGGSQTFSETVSISSGTTGNYKTFTVRPGDTVTAFGFTIGSHVKVINFHLQDVASPTTGGMKVNDGATDFFITGIVSANVNTWTICKNTVCTNGQITGGSISYPQSNGTDNNTGPAINVFCNGCLFDGIDMSHVSDFFQYTGNPLVFRNLDMHDALPSQCTIGGHGGNCHIDCNFSEPSATTGHVLIENNKCINVGIGGQGHFYLTQADVCGGNCDHVIERFNTGNTGSAHEENDNQWPHVKTYNNTCVDCGGDNGGTDTIAKSANNATDIDNIYYYSISISGTNAICASGCGSPNPTGFVGGNDLAWCTGASCNVFGFGYESSTWTGTGGSATNIKADPKFVNVSAGNYNLQSSSPARNAGRAHTTVAAGDSGSGTALVVTDPYMLYDGAAGTIAGVAPDGIKITSWGSSVIGITAINYATGTVTLASPVTRSVGDPIWVCTDSNGNNHCLDTTGIDIGAEQFSAGPALSLSPTSFNYGNVALGGSSTTIFTLSNPGSSSATVSTITYTGTNSGDFSTQSQTCGTLPAALASGANCSITVLFTPGGAGARSGTLNVTDTPDSISATAGLSGTGIAAAGGATVNGGIFNSGTIN